MNKFCIVIPIYKEKLDCIEKLSLTQLWNIIAGKHYHIYFVRPNIENFDMTEYYNLMPGWGDNVLEEAFDKKYFENTSTYSQLCISYGFYNSFSDYKYMYIFQLDCLLFEDKLEYFCDLDYDYIGAPILSTDCGWPTVVNGKYTPIVGNGGFSLRKISTFKEITDINGEFRKYYNITDKQLSGIVFEDNYFCVTVYKYYHFDIAPLNVALEFAWDMSVDVLWDKYKIQKFPMCAHAWNKNIRFWKEHLSYITEEISNYCENKHKDFFKKYYNENNSSLR